MKPLFLLSPRVAFAVMLLLASHAYAQEDITNPTEDSDTTTAPPSDTVPIPPKKHYFTATIENDGFASKDDQNYTSGLRFGMLDVGEKPFIVPQDAGDYLPLLTMNSTTSTYYSVGQAIFTPTNIKSQTEDLNDRPWAAFLYGSMGMETLKEDYVDDVELTLGVVGPAALGEEVQKGIHSIVGANQPEGWNNQLKNEPGVIMAWDRRWPERFQTGIGSTYLTAIPDMGVTLGNIYTYANVGGLLKLSSAKSRWNDQPLQAQPAMSGTGFFEPTDDLEWELFAGAQGRAIARNIFLDGNTIADSYSVSKEPFVADITTGLAFTWGSTRLSYTAVYRTKEFYAQTGGGTCFAGVSLGQNF